MNYYQIGLTNINTGEPATPDQITNWKNIEIDEEIDSGVYLAHGLLLEAMWEQQVWEFQHDGIALEIPTP